MELSENHLQQKNQILIVNLLSISILLSLLSCEASVKLDVYGKFNVKRDQMSFNSA